MNTLINKSYGLNSLGQVLKTQSSLRGLLEQLHKYEILTVQIRDLLPSELAPHLLMAQIQDERLVLLTDASVWASKLRFVAPKVRKEFPTVKTVRIAVQIPTSVQPESNPPVLKVTQPPLRTLSAHNAEQIGVLAAQIADSALKAALLRLAARGTMVLPLSF